MTGTATERLVQHVLRGEYCDVTVLCESGSGGSDSPQKVPMSKLVLAAFCPALKAGQSSESEVKLQAGRSWTR